MRTNETDSPYFYCSDEQRHIESIQRLVVGTARVFKGEKRSRAPAACQTRVHTSPSDAAELLRGLPLPQKPSQLMLIRLDCRHDQGPRSLISPHTKSDGPNTTTERQQLSDH